MSGPHIRPRGNRLTRAAGASSLVVALLVLGNAPAFAAGTFYVDTQHPSASNSNPGTEALPYKTISGAAALRNGPGTTIIVKPGTYREMVSVPASGALDNPYVFQASGPGVIVDGSDDLSGASHWELFSGTVHRAAGVTWSPKQVFVDGVRLAPSTSAPESLAVNSFVYVNGAGGGLFVNLGGDDPGAHVTLVGRRSVGFRLSARSYVTVEGFTVVRTEDRALYALNGASHVVFRSNTVSHAYRYGIALDGSAGSLVERNTIGNCQDHGIALTDTSTGCIIRDNESFGHAHPTIRQANGIYLNRSMDNLIQGNRLHHNQDSGLQQNTSSNGNRSIQNISWSNGDHGYDTLNSMNATFIGCVAYANYKDGFSIEGASSGAKLYNSIAVDNGIHVLPADGLLETDLWVDAQSAVGFQSDYNIFWNSTSVAPVRYVLTSYASVAAYSAASGQDAHSLQVDPGFVDPANGNFELLPSSPAIDAAHSGVADWPVLDALGRNRIDAPAVANTGVGGIAFADRGALEFQTDQAPVVVAPAGVSVNEGAPLVVNVSAADPDGQAIGSLVATDLPPGATFTPGPGNTSGTLDWTPGFEQAGSYTVTFTATNVLSGSISTTITVGNTDRAPVVIAQPTASTDESVALSFDVTAADPDGDAISSFAATDLPPGATFTPGPGDSSGTFTWTPGFDQAGVVTVTFTAANALSGSAGTSITVGNIDRAPVVTAQPSAATGEGVALSFDVTASDPDGDAISSWTVADLPTGATFTPGPGDSSGTLEWTPGFDQTGSYVVTFSATNALSDSASTTITVSNTDRAPVVTAQLAASTNEGVALSFAVTAADPDGDAISSLSAADLPAGATFTPGPGDTTGTLDWTPTLDQAGSFPVTFTAANVLSGSATTTITVVNVDRAPVVTAQPSASTAEGVALSFDVTAADPDGDAISSLTAAGLPAGATFTPGPGNTSGTLVWTPGFDQAGGFAVTFTAANALSGAAGTTITVDNTDRAPVVTAQPTATVNENVALSFTVSASDPDGDVISSFTADLPAGATFTPGPDNTSGTFTWTPGFAQAGSFPVTFTASNALAGAAGTTVTVVNVDRAPVVTAQLTASTNEGVALSFDVTAADPDGDAIASFVATGLPAGASFTPGPGNTSGTLAWTPGFTQAGNFPVAFTASNTLAGSASTMITVVNVNGPPVVTAQPTASASEGALLSFSISAADPDGDAISSLTVADLPAGATFTPGPGNASGTLTWTPGFDQAGNYTVTFTAANAFSGSASTTITVGNTDRAPIVTAQPTASVNENVALTFSVTAADPDGDAISSFTADLPAGATFTPGPGNTSGTFAWTPGFAQAGSFPVTFTASNALSGSAGTTVTVANVDRAPVVTAQLTASTGEGAALSFDVTAADPDGDVIASFIAASLPAGASFTPGPGNTSGTLDWTPGFSQAGSFAITFTASNTLAGSASTMITVADVDPAPVVTAQPTASASEGALLSFSISAADPDGGAIGSLTATGLPAGATFTPGAGNTSGTLEWTPGFDQTGSYTVTFTAANALSGSASTTITVNNTDRAPVVTAQPTASTNEGVALSINVAAADPDGDAIASFTAADLPMGATFTPGPGNTSGTLDWTPGTDQAGGFAVTFTAANALSGSASTTITVNNTDRAPVVTAQLTASTSEGVALSFNVTAADPDGDAIGSFTATDLPPGATFTPGPGNTGGTLDWTPAFAQAGSFAVTFTASNALSGSASTMITVDDVDLAPVVTAQPTASAEEGLALSFGVTAGDPDGDAITSLTAAGLPAGATFTPGPGNTSGTLDWTPGFDQTGSFTVTFTAANALSGSVSTTITVDNTDRAPVVTAQPTASVDEGVALSFNVTAADPDGDAIGSFTAADLPPGATFTPGPGDTSGTFDWTPGPDQAGGFTVTFTATNALSGSASTTITVGNVDRAPVVTAQATASVGEGVALSFNVTASDPDGDAITSLTATDLPPGATFTPGPGNTTGAFEWTPAFGQTGSFTVTFTATNALSGSDSTTITVGDVDRAPVVTAQSTISVNDGALLSFEVHATDPDGDPITSLTAKNLPPGATFTPGPDNTTGMFAWTPTPDQAGSYTVTFTASNTLSGSVSTTITVNAVTAVDPAAAILARPVLSPSPMRARSTLSFHLPTAGLLEVSIHDVTGRLVRRVAQQWDAPAGVHRLDLDGRSDSGELLSSGVYFYSVRTAQGVKTGRLVIAR